MVPEAIASQTREEITERLLSDAPESARGETHSFLIALDEPALLELIGHALQPREVARGVVTEDVAQGFLGRVVERLTAVHPAQPAFEFLDRLEAIHDAHRLIERELLVAEERVSLAEVTAIGEQLETAHQLGELRLQVRVAERRRDHLLELVAHLRATATA